MNQFEQQVLIEGEVDGTLFRYDTKTGQLWRFMPREMWPGKWQETGLSLCPKGYHMVNLDGKSRRLHRIAWKLVYGSWPDDEIDHIDHDKSNNTIVNLRVCSTAENCKNRSPYKNTKSGHLGVTWHPATKKWSATIGVNKKLHYLGVFADINEAIAARKSAEQKYGFHENHGKAI